MSILSDRLRVLRGDTSQAEMARQLNMPRQQWINYEIGKNAPGADIITKICRVHACSSDWLLGLTDKQFTPANSVSVNAACGGVAIGGVGNHVSGTIVAASDIGHAPQCAKCPYKKKVKAFEKLISK